MSWLDTAAQVATAAGLLVAVAAYFYESARARKQHAIERFFHLNEQYRQWLVHYLEHPELQEVLPHAPRANHLTPSQRTTIALLELKLCELESAFFLYKRHRTAFDRAQWQGWEDYIYDWVANPKFRKAWKTGLGDEYDSEFRAYVQSVVVDYESRHPNDAAKEQESGIDDSVRSPESPLAIDDGPA